ncbi:ATP synthase F1 subunit delta [Kamptonema cortianum]|nr:ATP synthase F1 subunit delta [Oscillatoria laete-virens]MDK3160327.1 ATP synthase F1 subunit delta [Kamptonema cortianum]MDL5053711.1 ATP synthase F1 subunit delta [Oscillatoria laete-virens NRMC-F 0139]
MKNSRQAIKQAKKFLRACTGAGALDEGRALNIVKALVDKKPHGYRDILSAFARLLRLEIQKRTVLIESAAALEDSAVGKIKAVMEKAHGAGLAFERRTNPALLAGIRIRAGSDIYDGSVAGKLARLKESF